MSIVSAEQLKTNWCRMITCFLCRALATFVIAVLVLVNIPSNAFARTSRPKAGKHTKWVLEFEQDATGKWGGQGKVWGSVEFLMPKAGGAVDAEGPMWLDGTNAKGVGSMFIEGNVSKKRLTFIPGQKYFTVTVYGQTQNMQYFAGTEKVRMPFRDGAKLTQRVADAGGTTETTWTLQGIEEWRVTVESRQISFPDKPELPLPQGHFAGLRNQWRLVVNFEVTEDSYTDGKGKFSVVKWDSYSEPRGLYKAVRLRHHILDDLAAHVDGEKSGQWVTLLLPKGNRIDFVYRLEKKKERTSYRVEGEPADLPSELIFKLVEGRRDYKHFEGPLSEKKQPGSQFYRGKPNASFWKGLPWGAHVVIVVKRIR